MTPRRSNLQLKKNKHQSRTSPTNKEVTVASSAAAVNQQSQKQHLLSQAELHDLCILSFNETLEKLKSSSQLSWLSSIPIDAIISKDYPVFLKKYKDNKNITSPWKIDYTAKESFRENDSSRLSHSMVNVLRNLCAANSLG